MIQGVNNGCASEKRMSRQVAEMERELSVKSPSFGYVVRSLREGIICTSYKRAALAILAADESDASVDEFWRVMRSEAEPAANTFSDLHVVSKSNAATLNEYARYVAIMNQLPDSERYHVDAFEVR